MSAVSNVSLSDVLIYLRGPLIAHCGSRPPIQLYSEGKRFIRPTSHPLPVFSKAFPIIAKSIWIQRRIGEKWRSEKQFKRLVFSVNNQKKNFLNMLLWSKAILYFWSSFKILKEYYKIPLDLPYWLKLNFDDSGNSYVYFNVNTKFLSKTMKVNAEKLIFFYTATLKIWIQIGEEGEDEKHCHKENVYHCKS